MNELCELSHNANFATDEARLSALLRVRPRCDYCKTGKVTGSGPYCSWTCRDAARRQRRKVRRLQRMREVRAPVWLKSKVF